MPILIHISVNKKISSNESKYSTKNPLKRYFLNKFINRLLVLFSKGKFSNLLDVGCGEGFTEKIILEKFTKAKLTGIDISLQAIKKASLRNPQAKYLTGSVFKLPFKNRSFDLVICLEVLEHLKTPQKALTELIRVTRKRLIISVPNEPLFTILRFFGGQNIPQLGRHPEHVNFWNKRSFSEFLKDQNHRVTIETCGPWLIAKIRKN